MSKNLHDLSDEEFDDLFRDSAEKSDIGFDPEAWNKMSQKLDAASAPPSSPGKGSNPLTKWGLPTMIVLLLLITGTYFLLRKPTRAITETKGSTEQNSVKQTDKVGEKDVATDKVGTANQENAKETTTANDKVETDKVVTTEIKGDTKRTNDELKSADASTNRDGKVLPVENEKKAKITSFDSKSSNINQSKISQTTEKSSDILNRVMAKYKTERKSQQSSVSENKRGNDIAQINKQQSLLQDNGATNNLVPSVKTDNISSTNAANNDLKTSAQSQPLTVDSANIIEKMQWAPVHALSPTKHLFAIDLRLPNIRFESPALAPVSIPRANTAFRRGLNIRLAISPDLSFIPSNKIFKVGNNWAAILEYRFNNRMSIQTGVIRSLKYYGALPSQYEWNAYWAMPSPLKDIDATCKMLDIPLNLRYDISQKPNSRWFVGGGFTSYIMLKEEYRYNYENPYDPNIKRTSWEGKTGAYPFSVLNLSVGYERQLFRRLTFQAEPFYKAPLGKVGYGKVRLATAGVFFSVKYPF